jgi:hypothetical protein
MRGSAERSLRVVASEGPDTASASGPLGEASGGFHGRPAQVPAAAASCGLNSGAFSP